MAGKKRIVGRDDADFVSRCGLPPQKPLDYLTYVQLKLNEGRMDLQQANLLALALGMANSSDNISYEQADALALDPAETDEILYQANRERVQARFKARARGSMPQP